MDISMDISMDIHIHGNPANYFDHLLAVTLAIGFYNSLHYRDTKQKEVKY